MHDAAARGIIACRMCLLFTKEIDLMHACEMVDSNEPLSLTYTKRQLDILTKVKPLVGLDFCNSFL